MLTIKFPCQDIFDKGRCVSLFLSILLIFLLAQAFMNMQGHPDYYGSETKIIIYVMTVFSIVLFLISFIRCNNNNNIEYSLIN